MSRATLASAWTRLARLTIPTTSWSRTTGRRLIWRFSISRTISSSGVSSVIVRGSAVMISLTLRPWARVYSSASRPGPMRYSSQRGRRRCVPVSARRRKSPSVTIPTRPPFWSITGKPLMCRCSMIRTACQIEAPGSIDTTGDVITSLAFMAGLHFGFLKAKPPFPPSFDLHQPVAAKEPAPVLSSQSQRMRDGCAAVVPLVRRRTHRVITPIYPPGVTRGPIDCATQPAASEASARSACGVSKRPHHILARDDAHQLALGADNGKAASLQAHHQLENASQRRRRFDVHDGLGHHFRHRAFHQFIVVRHHLTGGEGERFQKIEFGHDTQHLSFLHDREGIEIMFPEQRFQISERKFARHGRDITRHVFACRALEKSIHRSTRIVVCLLVVRLPARRIIFRSFAAVNARIDSRPDFSPTSRR